MPELIYLAAPYSSPDPAVEDERCRIVSDVAGILIVRTGCEVFSPITHSHPLNRMAQRYAEVKGMPWQPSYDFWLRFDFRVLDIADYLSILRLDGWRESVGIKRELERFGKRFPTERRRISYYDYSDFFSL